MQNLDKIINLLRCPETNEILINKKKNLLISKINKKVYSINKNQIIFNSQYLINNNFADIKNKINCVFHYQPLNKSIAAKKYMKINNDSYENSIKFADTIVRLPLYHSLNDKSLQKVVNKIKQFCNLKQ